jgi:hypothetical protein
VSKEREGEVVNKEKKGEFVEKEREEEVVSKIQQSITKTANTPEPPRTISSRVITVLGHESSVLLDNRDDSLLTADGEAEPSPPSHLPPPPLEETVLEIGDEG